MNLNRDFDQILRVHFEARADRTVADGQLDAILDETASVRQRPGWLAAMRSLSMSTTSIATKAAIPRSAWLLALLGALVVLALAAAALIGSHRTPALPFNGRIVFGRFDAALNDTVTYAVNPDGSHLVKLRPEVHEGPRWSPDGQRIGMTDAVMNADGSGYHARDFSRGTMVLAAWDWSPDGERLLMEGFNPNDPVDDAKVHGVYTVRASDGGDLVRLTGPNDGGIPGAYSPDGSTVAWVRPQSGKDSGRLMLVDVDGSHQRQVGILTVGLDPTWAPDGRSLLVSSAGRLYSVDVATGDATPIRAKTAPESTIWGGVWSPDGTRILFKRVINGDNTELFTMRPDGTDVIQVTNDPDDDRFMDWGIHPLD